ncbi:transposase [Thermosynechococcus sp. Uc]|uniref:transposase n=1 Tax=Thermosynechococcus sp. Uc TaxID=3034853 RepID=UPI00345C285D
MKHEVFTSEAVISFGKRHDLSFQEEVIEMIPENVIAIMERAFAIWKFLDKLYEAKKLFVVGIKNNMRTEVNHRRYRIVHFWNIESKREFQILTNPSGSHG